MKIKDLDTGIIYDTPNDVMREFNIKDRSNLHTCLRGETKSCAHHHFAYIDDNGNIVTDKQQAKQEQFLKWMMRINTAFNFQQWGHWASLKGLIKLFNVPKTETVIFTKVLRLNFQSTHSTRSGSFYPCTNINGFFFYTPLFQRRYWPLIVELKKQVPVIIDIEKRGPVKQIEHGYEMLCKVKLIPTAEQIREYQNQPFAEKVFDFEAVKPVTMTKKKFLQNNKRVYRKHKKS